jgi:hypothetical protein
MVRRTSFINKIRELNYTYKTRQKRTDLWRKKGTTEFISLPVNDLLEDDWVLHTLRHAGLSKEEAQAFLSSARF